MSETKSRSHDLKEKAAEGRRRRRDWLLPFMQDNSPEFLTKRKLRGAAAQRIQAALMLLRNDSTLPRIVSDCLDNSLDASRT
jgi:hypothetical protein